MKEKLLIISTHPIQYHAPLFRYLSEFINLKVLYLHNPDSEQRGKLGFGKNIDWGLDLLEGYEYEFLNNESKSPNLYSFFGSKLSNPKRIIKSEMASHILVMSWYQYGFLQLIWAANKLGLKVAGRADNKYRKSYKSLIRKMIYPFFFSFFDTLFYVGYESRKYFKKNGAPDFKLKFFPHAVHQEFWEYRKKRSTGDIKFLWVGKMYDLKRPIDMVSAFMKVRDDGIKLTMVGDGPMMQEVKKYASNDRRIQFAGFADQNKLKEIYHEHHTLVMTSENDTWGIVVNEAFSCGLTAIVSTGCGCALDLVENGKTGYIYQTGDIKKLSERIMDSIIDHKYKSIEMRNAIFKKNQIFSFQEDLKTVISFLKR